MTARKLNSKINKRVYALCETINWPLYQNFSDKRKNDRRLSFMRNGARLKPEAMQQVLTGFSEFVNTNPDVKDHVLSFSWIEGESDCHRYGTYDKFVVFVKQ